MSAKAAALALLTGLLCHAAHAAVGASKPLPDSARYSNCLASSSANPAAALADAENWAKSGGGVPAAHCAALALVSLKRYGDAGARLDRIAADPAVPDVSFRAELFTQAGNAWLLAGNGAKAAQSLTAALTLSSGDADLFADLARAQAMQRKWQEADHSLVTALNMSPRRADLLVLRASARRALKRYAAARDDIEAALKLKPGDGAALVERGLLRRQVGDIGGARRDFQTALKSDAAAEARAHLDALGP
jgi:tetratricopeptide (TPR) repeat protein